MYNIIFSVRCICPGGATSLWKVNHVELICPAGQPINTHVMSDTYTQLYIHLVFSVKGRSNFIQPVWEGELHKYITAVVQNDRHKLLAINGTPDHIHIFLGLNPAFAISD